VSSTHNRDITHVDVARNHWQSLRANLWLIAWRHKRRVVFAQGVGRQRLTLAVQFFIQDIIFTWIDPATFNFLRPFYQERNKLFEYGVLSNALYFDTLLCGVLHKSQEYITLQERPCS
jgi:hypothetical protein